MKPLIAVVCAGVLVGLTWPGFASGGLWEVVARKPLVRLRANLTGCTGATFSYRGETLEVQGLVEVRSEGQVFSGYSGPAMDLEVSLHGDNGAVFGAEALAMDEVSWCWADGVGRYWARLRVPYPHYPPGLAWSPQMVRVQVIAGTGTDGSALARSEPFLLLSGLLAVEPRQGYADVHQHLSVLSMHWSQAGWMLTKGDDCTPILPGWMMLERYEGALEKGDTYAVTAVGIRQGVGAVALTAPMKSGQVDVRPVLDGRSEWAGFTGVSPGRVMFLERGKKE